MDGTPWGVKVMKVINKTTGIVEFDGDAKHFSSIEMLDTVIGENGMATRKNQEYEIVLSDSEKKVQGFDFNGVMCSATKDDQFGLSGMWMQYESLKAVGKADEFAPQAFHFENGSVLVLTKDNIDAFRAVWLPFRMSFFPVPDAA
jgi:hypothetical protein